MSNSKILVVDDDENIRFSLSLVLEDFGFDVISSNSSWDAIEKIKKENISLAIVDLSLPDANGEDLITDISQLNPSIVNIIHTGSVNYTIPETLRSIGITPENILHKPITNFDDLKDKIVNLLSP